MKVVDNMAHIPYIAHKRQMCKAYMREKRLKLIILLNNLLWAAICLCVMR